MRVTLDSIPGGLFIISGPAAVGKSAIVKELIKKHPEIIQSVSCTTRKPRPEEQDGVDYFFLTTEEFKQKINNDELYEYQLVHNNYYGTPKDFILKAIASGKDVIAVLDTKGYEHVRMIAPAGQITGIFIAPPSINDLIARLKNRGTETEAEIRTRINNMKKEFEMSSLYHHLIINEDWTEIPNALERAADRVWAIMSARRTSRQASFEFINQFIADLNIYTNKL